MNPYSNLPPEQRRIQRLVSQFNADERLWRFLEGKRRLRRKLYPRIPAKRRKHLDLLDFAKSRPLQDCIGEVERRPGVREIRVRETSGAYRLLYVAKFEEAVYVLHVFHKKEQRTSEAEIMLARARYRSMIQWRKEHGGD